MAMPDTRLYPSPDRPLWTVADLEALPDDGNRYEILHGELLVTRLPSNGHQGVAGRLFRHLANWCAEHSGWACRTPGGVYVSETTWLEPDIAIYPAPEYAALSWREMPPPLLVVEVASRSTRRRDRHRKRPAYLTRGVCEVWTVDADRRVVERWTSASEFPETHGEQVVWSPEAGLPPLTLTAAELFGPPPEPSAPL
jgi:Uma2 family endonuclease